jgi:hypothetical protein
MVPPEQLTLVPAKDTYSLVICRRHRGNYEFGVNVAEKIIWDFNIIGSI